MSICDIDFCTGCEACKDVCPKSCISMIANDYSTLYPKINEAECINCGACIKTCPNNSPIGLKKPQSMYVAWSNDTHQRKTSASGGIAYEIYRHYVGKGAFCTGVTLDEDGCYFIPVVNNEDISNTKNSKYVFSSTNGIYRKIKEELRINHVVVFIGLPCQVAGLYAYLKVNYDNLYTVDLICHGIAPYEFFRQHINHINNKRNKNLGSISFRDPEFGTKNYHFTLRDKSNIIYYDKVVRSMDAYQLGFHRALIYRENCYHCNYARKERVGDITIGDFSGLGRVRPIDYPKENCSCLIINSSKGCNIVDSIKDSIYLEIRPQEEAFNYEKQFQQPSEPHRGRKQFLSTYKKTQSFQKATRRALWIDRLVVFVRFDKWESDIRSLLRIIIPSSLIHRIRGK